MNDSHGLNLIFAGTPNFAAVHLQALLASQHNIIAIYTQPDRPAGRGKKLSPSPVKVLAEEHNIPIYQPVSLKNNDAQREFLKLHADLMVVVAYGLLLPQPILDAPRLGCINVHGSLLPKWRGAAPIQRAVESGDKISGVTIMQMDIGLDTGDMLLTSECPISPSDTAGDLHDKLCRIGPTALLKTLSLLAQEQCNPQPQDHSKSSYAKKLHKAEALIDWQVDANVLCRKIHAFNPSPVCYCQMATERLKIYRAEVAEIGIRATARKPGEVLQASDGKLVIACGSGALALREVQLPGKKPIQVHEFLNGFAHKLKEGTLLEAPA